ncbi:large ribosomal subunit protein mL48 [Synchiropus picturatus]
MHPVLRKVSPLLSQALFLCRATPLSLHPVGGGVTLRLDRHYNGMPTYGIGRWRHLLIKEAPKKKKERIQMKEMLAASSTCYGTLNVEIAGYDMTLVEHYSQYIHNLCHRLNITVSDCYALPTHTKEVYLMQEQGTKMLVDSILKTHTRVVQLKSLTATLCPTLMELLLKNQPEGVQLSVKEHTEADFLGRFKARPELEGLISQINQ